MLISILLVNFNDWDNCLRIAKQFASNPKYEIVIVDNNSSKNTEVINKLKLFENVKIVFHDHNSGYSTGNNLAFTHSSGNIVVISNPDVEFSINVLDSFLDKLNDNVVLWPDIYLNKNDLQEYIYGIEPTPKVKFMLLMNKILPFLFIKYAKQFHSEDIENRFSSSGCFFAMKRETAKKIFPLDENIFLYNEEVLIGKKMKENKISCIIDKSSKVYHKEKPVEFNYLLYYEYVKSERFIYKNYYEYSVYADLIFIIRVIFTFLKTVSVKKTFKVAKLWKR